MFTTIAEDVTVSFSAITLRGDVEFIAPTRALVLTSADGPGEVLTTNLGHYGLEPREDTVFIKDWSEHSGLAASLEAAGVVEIVRAVNVGPFKSRAYEVRVLAPADASELVGA
jgi:hypothetical protein